MEARELEIFSEMCELAKHVQNYQQIVKAIMDKLSKTIDYTIAVILLLDEEEIITNTIYPSTKNFHDKTIELVYKNLPSDIKEKKQLTNLKKIIYEDIENSNTEKAEHDKVENFLIVPLMVRDELHGFFCITSGNKNIFTKRDKDILTIFANQSSILIDNTKLYAQTEQRIMEMSILHEVGKVLSSVLNLDRLLKIIVEKSGELTRANRISIMMYTPEKDKFIVKAHHNLPNEATNAFVLKNERITGFIASHKKPVLVNDITSTEPFNKICNTEHYETNSFMSFPLTIRYRVVGVLHVSNKINGSAFDNEDFELLETFISQATVAIENALLYGEMEQMAITDGLTHIYNHRYFQEELGREIKRATRYKLNLSLLMIDIDYFKQYNDKYGHPKGDQVLKKVAAIIKKCVRNVDIVARYGGEEFIIIVPETDMEDAYDVAERMRNKVSSEIFPGIEKNEDVKVTISIGVASYAGQGEKTKDKLIEEADIALYKAKKEGRNKVCMYNT
ncbi:diguanylate cyclase [Candidatus Poribacteria bacterium]|nr:diguanylate cyclase [Candidatus Poribacteria bacterium]